MPGAKLPNPKTLEEARKIIATQHRALQKHPAARANRIIHLVLFALGGLILVAAGIGLDFGDASTTIQLTVAIFLVAPETIGVLGATEVAKGFASGLGSNLGKAIASRKKE